MNRDNLLKFEVPEIIFGNGALAEIGQCAQRLGGERVLLVTDPGVRRAGWVDAALESIDACGLDAVIYDNVVTNPRDFQVEQGVALYRAKGCDVIVAVGGGSPIDTAKGIAILATNHGTIHEYEGCNRVTQPIPPLICTPTTAGTGADISQFAVIGDSKRKMKMTLLSRAITPDISLIDPRVLETLSPELIAATGMDALTHAIEAYVSSLSWSMTDPHAIHAVELVSEHLANAAAHGGEAAFAGMAVASLEAGIAFSNAILGAVHALAHPLGGLYDIHHGLANAVLLPVVVQRNIGYSTGKYARIAAAMGAKTHGMAPEKAAAQVPEMIQGLIAALGLPTRLSEIGVRRRDIPEMAQKAKAEPCMLTNPHPYSATEIESMYLEAF